EAPARAQGCADRGGGRRPALHPARGAPYRCRRQRCADAALPLVGCRDPHRPRLHRPPRPGALDGARRPAPQHLRRALDVAAAAPRQAGGAGLPRRRPGAAGDPGHRPLLARSRHPGTDLCDARLGAQHRRRPRRAARPRLRRLLRRRGLFLCAAGAVFRPLLLGLPAAGRDPRRLLGRPPRLPGAQAAGRLPGHRHARLRRDHPRRAAELGEPDRRAERHQRHPAPLLLRPALQHVGRRGDLRRLLRAGALIGPPRHLPLLPDPGARIADQLGDDPAAPPAARPRLGGAARGRDRLPRARDQRHRHQADGLRARRDVRRLRRRLLRHAAGLHQPGELHLHRERHHPGHRRARRPRQPDRRRHRGTRADRRDGDLPRPAGVADARLRRRHGRHHGAAAAGPGRHAHSVDRIGQATSDRRQAGRGGAWM
ncbi:MAG: Branched-chain amino acid transport system permease protein LivM, partial [uncultured Craurococcus sp.]